MLTGRPFTRMKPDEDPKAKLVFVHGFSDHVNRYYGFFPYLASRGIAVYGFDQRGWGRSVRKPAERGLTGPTSEVVAEIAAFVRTQLPSPVPLFVMGHSMGGGEVLTLASDAAYEEDVLAHVRGWLLEAPFLGWPKGEAPSTLKVVLGRLAGRLLPHQHLRHVIPPENLTRDPAVVESIREDPLCHNTGTLEGLASLLDRTAALAGGEAKLCAPPVRSLWLGHGTADLGTGYDASREWFDRQTGLQDKEFKSYEGWYHQLHVEPGEMKEEFYRDVAGWILARCDEGGAVAAAAGDAGAPGDVAAGAAPGDAEAKPEAKL